MRTKACGTCGKLGHTASQCFVRKPKGKKIVDEMYDLETISEMGENAQWIEGDSCSTNGGKALITVPRFSQRQSDLGGGDLGAGIELPR